MGRQIIKQPNGLYAVFSSIVDDFIIVDATPQEIIQEYINEAEEEITKQVIHQVKKSVEPNRHRFTFEEACEQIKIVHGSQAESLKYFSQKNQNIHRGEN